ncbi:MAG: glucosidase family protein [Armatimonadota bacterium]
MTVTKRVILSIVFILTTGWSFTNKCESAPDIHWIINNPNKIVSSTRGYDKAGVSVDHWEGLISDTNDPVIEFSKASINASKSKYLYIKMAAQSGNSIQVFFASNGGFTEDLSFRCNVLENGDSPAIYRIDLSKYPKWQGVIRSIRLDLDGCTKGSKVKIYGIGVSERPIESNTGIPLIDYTVDPQPRNPGNRMAAFQDMLVATDEVRPVSCISTYTNDPGLWTNEYILTQFIPGIEVDGQVYWPASARKLVVEDFPGGVIATYTVKGIQVTTKFVPLMVGRDTPEQDGAAVFSIETTPAVPVVIKCGGSSMTGLEGHRINVMRKNEMPMDNDSVTVRNGTALLTSKIHRLTVGLAGTGPAAVEQGASGGQFCAIRLPKGSGQIVASFAENADTAEKLTRTDTKSGLKKVADYYAKLLQSRIDTPEKSMNEAFRSALYNLEYNWYSPIGWVECIDHWPALWHMQHTGGADWIGQADRSQLCNQTTANHLFTNGAVPQFYPKESVHRDFGGSNQFFMWQVMHNWQMTADKESIKKLAPYLDKVIAQTFYEYDRDNDGLLAWGQQIGNQEDYSSTPFNGTSPSIEGINILRTGAVIARALGDESKAKGYEARASHALGLLRKELWQPDLGMFMYFKDPFGEVRPDGLYHSLIYPVIWGVLDPIDSWTSIRHMRDRLTGPNGEVYCSNTFPNHIPGTWGMQAGVAQQPWAAWGLSKIGLRNKTWKPLKAAADWAMSPDHRGSWPEIADESHPSYFSPPAGLYIQSTIEALFGLQVRKPEGRLIVSPSFPDKWPFARLNLPEYSADYIHNGNSYRYTVKSKDDLIRDLEWMLPPCKITRFTVNGKPAEYTLKPGVGVMTLLCRTSKNRQTEFAFTIEPTKCNVTSPKSVAEGSEFNVSVSGCAVKGIIDRSGIFSSIAMTGQSSMQVKVKDDLIKPYMNFGRLGQMNFSRRSFFLTCVTPGGVEFHQPVDITILPAYECAQKGSLRISSQGANIGLLVRNNTFSQLKGTAWLNAIQQRFPFTIDLKPRSEGVSMIHVPASVAALFSPGQNIAQVTLPNHHELDVTILADALFNDNNPLGKYARGRIAQLKLPDTRLIEDTKWGQIRDFYAYGHMPWNASRPPLESLAGKTEVTVPGLPGVSFGLEDRKFIPISWKNGTPEFTLDMDSVQYRKLYLLVVPFFDNHDTYSTVGRVTVRVGNGGIISKTLAFPGDLDWWCPEEVVGGFATARYPRSDRFGLCKLLKADESDWSESKPPVFPQVDYWASSLPFKTPSAVMSVVEVDLGRLLPVKSITLSTIGIDPAFGLVAISGERAGMQELLDGTPWQIDARFHEPKVLFRFTKPDDLQGWRTEGEAFSVTPFPGLFMTPTLNSLAVKGEMGTGKVFSPDFTIGNEYTHLRFVLQGGNSVRVNGTENLVIELVDSVNGEVLGSLPILGSHLMREEMMSVAKCTGRKVHLLFTDASAGSSYAWLGVQEISLVAM